MSKIKVSIRQKESFGQRLARLRKAAGYSQRELGDDIGVSQRVVAYYETESEFAPTHFIPLIAKALSVSADQLLGLEKAENNKKVRDNRLWRRFKQIEKFAPNERKQIVQILDAFIGRAKLQKAR